MPSYVAFTDSGDRLIGDSAKNQVNSNPKNTVFDAKRLIGKKFSDPEVQKDITHYSFDVKPDSSGKPLISVNKGEFHPEQISSMVLEKMKDIASTFVGQDITKAVVTVPAYFNDSQDRLLKMLPLLRVLRFLELLMNLLRQQWRMVLKIIVVKKNMF